VHADLPAERLHQTLADRQPQARAAVACGWSTYLGLLEIALKSMRLLLGSVRPMPVSVHLETQQAALRPGVHDLHAHRQ
jgi:hypothetical protein